MPIDRDKPIGRERVVRTALALLDEIGLDKLTLRRIAAALDVQAPALYWHFRNKKELLDAMGTAVLMEAVPDDTACWADMSWQDFLRDYCHGLRAALLKYRDGAKMVPGTYLTDTGMYAVQEASLRVFTAAGFSADTAYMAINTAYSYTVGFAIEEQAMYPRPDMPDDNYAPERRLARIDAAVLPTVAELAACDRKRATEEYFVGGLSVIITGLESVLAQSDGGRGAGP
jgi:TetR/AcrR family transcriptional regulator, tetracycline repressor protein